jgi:protein SCO1/2
MYTGRMMRKLLLPLLAAALTLPGCKPAPKPGPATANTQNWKAYKLRGKVVRGDAGRGEVVLDHEAIPGYMDAMTMPYKLKDPSILSELHPGDTITADVLVPPDPNADALLDHIVVVAQARPDYKPQASFHVPQPGETPPDFRLRNQDGRPVHLAGYRGRALLLTFLYTRCPSPKFCPLITRNFAGIEQRLAADPKLYARTHLLSVSFDPEHDTPERLRAYAAGYMRTGDRAAFAHWEFAVAGRPALNEMAKYFDLATTAEADESITHTLSTTLIGPDGRVARFYPGNEWTPEEVVADLRQTAGL